MWSSRNIRPLSRTALQLLADGIIPAIRMPDFASLSECQALGQALLRQSPRSQSVPEVERLGISQYAHGIQQGKAHYFALVAEAVRRQAQSFADSFDPLSRFINQMNINGIHTSLMEEPGWGQYFAGCGKVRTGFSPIHIDYAPQDSAGWAVAHSVHQLAWNLYLDKGYEGGGALLLWHKCWQPEDDIHQVSNCYYYKASVVAGLSPLRIDITPGEVLIINSRHFHAVEFATGRLAFGSFISLFEDGNARLWS
jgi:hypothetical protein